MGKGKLAKFADMAANPLVFEYPYSVIDDVPFDMIKVTRNGDFFKNENPIVLELGCGRGQDIHWVLACRYMPTRILSV